MDKKIVGFIQGLIFVAFGIIIAVAGGGTALDIYLGILCCVGGAAALAASIVTLTRRSPLTFGMVALGTILLTVGIALFTDYLTFASLINLLVFILIGFGGGMIIYGIYQVANRAPVPGLVSIIIGVGVIVLCVLFLTVADFRQAFWIIVGVLVALYGLLVSVTAILDKGGKK